MQDYNAGMAMLGSLFVVLAHQSCSALKRHTVRLGSLAMSPSPRLPMVGTIVSLWPQPQGQTDGRREVRGLPALEARRDHLIRLAVHERPKCEHPRPWSLPDRERILRYRRRLAGWQAGRLAGSPVTAATTRRTGADDEPAGLGDTLLLGGRPIDAPLAPY